MAAIIAACAINSTGVFFDTFILLFSFSFVLRVEGLEHTIHLTPEIGGKPDKTLFFAGFATGGSIAWRGMKFKPYPQFTHNEIKKHSIYNF
jgi:hypothetical protein